MPYANLDDRFPTHRKIYGLSADAFRVHVQGIIWCARYLTDGYIAAADLTEVARPVHRQRRAVTELETAGLWVPTSMSTPVDNPDHGATTGPPRVSPRVHHGFTDVVPGDAPSATTHGPGWMVHDYLDWNKSAAWWESERAASRDRQARHRKGRNAVTNAVSHTVSHGTPDQTRPEKEWGGTVTPLRPAPSTASTPPPRRCPTHLDDPDPPACRRCADARQTRAEWDATQLTVGNPGPGRDSRAIPSSAQCPLHRGWPATNCAPCRSELLAVVDEP